MSIKKDKTPPKDDLPPGAVDNPLSLKELTSALIKHYDLHDGCYELMMQYKIGVGRIGPDPETSSPGAMVGVEKVGLIRSQKPTPRTVDASISNPAPEKKVAAPKKPRKATNKV